MPAYTYKCMKCDKMFEIKHHFFEKQEICINCGAKNPIKLINYVPRIIYRGSGWVGKIHES